MRNHGRFLPTNKFGGIHAAQSAYLLQTVRPLMNPTQHFRWKATEEDSDLPLATKYRPIFDEGVDTGKIQIKPHVVDYTASCDYVLQQWWERPAAPNERRVGEWRDVPVGDGDESPT